MRTSKTRYTTAATMWTGIFLVVAAALVTDSAIINAPKPVASKFETCPPFLYDEKYQAAVLNSAVDLTGGCISKFYGFPLQAFKLFLGNPSRPNGYCNYNEYDDTEIHTFECVHKWTESDIVKKNPMSYVMLHETKGKGQPSFYRCALYELLKEEGHMLIAISEDEKCKDLKGIISSYTQVGNSTLLHLSPNPKTSLELDQKKQMNVNDNPSDQTDMTRSKREVQQCRFPDWMEGQWLDLLVEGSTAKYTHEFDKEDLDVDDYTEISDDIEDDDAEITIEGQSVLRPKRHAVDFSQFDNHFGDETFQSKKLVDLNTIIKKRSKSHENLKEYLMENLDAELKGTRRTRRSDKSMRETYVSNENARLIHSYDDGELNIDEDSSQWSSVYGGADQRPLVKEDKMSKTLASPVVGQSKEHTSSEDKNVLLRAGISPFVLFSSNPHQKPMGLVDIIKDMLGLKNNPAGPTPPPTPPHTPPRTSISEVRDSKTFHTINKREADTEPDSADTEPEEISPEEQEMILQRIKLRGQEKAAEAHILWTAVVALNETISRHNGNQGFTRMDMLALAERHRIKRMRQTQNVSQSDSELVPLNNEDYRNLYGSFINYTATPGEKHPHNTMKSLNIHLPEVSSIHLKRHLMKSSEHQKPNKKHKLTQYFKTPKPLFKVDIIQDQHAKTPRSKRSVVEQVEEQPYGKSRFGWRCVSPVENKKKQGTKSLKFLTWGGRILQEEPSTDDSPRRRRKKLDEMITKVGEGATMSYGCLWFRSRGPNIVEFTVLDTGMPKPNESLEDFARELCRIKTKEELMKKAVLLNNKKIRNRWWITETRPDENERIPTACPVPPGTVFYGVVPAPPMIIAAKDKDVPLKAVGISTTSPPQLCARMVSSADNCGTKQPTGPFDRMKYTVSECVEQNVTANSTPQPVTALPKIETVFEEIEYQCLGQWSEKVLQKISPTEEKLVTMTYTYVRRVDPLLVVGATEYECFVGTTIPNENGQSTETTTTLLLTEAGTGNKCSRVANPYRDGMKLVGTRVTTKGSECAGSLRRTQVATGGFWYPLKPQQLPTSEDDGVKWYSSDGFSQDSTQIPPIVTGKPPWRSIGSSTPSQQQQNEGKNQQQTFKPPTHVNSGTARIVGRNTISTWLYIIVILANVKGQLFVQ